MHSRLLIVFIALVLLHQASVAQQSATPSPQDAPDTCPITKPPAQPFVPPAPYTLKVPPDGFLYGTNDLWTMLPNAGSWRGLPHQTSDGRTFITQKLFWWAEGLYCCSGHPLKLMVTGKRLDSPAPPLIADDANAGWTTDKKDQPFMVITIDFPTPGCWEIRGQYTDLRQRARTLSYVIRVAQ
jgi:hypothetical protein